MKRKKSCKKCVDIAVNNIYKIRKYKYQDLCGKHKLEMTERLITKVEDELETLRRSLTR